MRNQALRSFVIGGLLPVIAFTVIEEKWGTLWGIVAGMVFGVGEILWDWRTQGRVDRMTWMGAFFGVHTALAVYAALYWSTEAWAMLKGVGFTLSLVLYLLAETLFLRYRLASK